MKKQIIVSIAAVLVVTSAYSQGLINFSGGVTAATRMSTNSVVGGPSTGLAGGGSGTFYFALFASASQSSINGNTSGISGLSANYVFENLSGWSLVGFATNTATAGHFAPATQGASDATQGALNGDNSLTVQGIPGASTANIVVVGWGAAGIGTTLSALESWYSAGGNNGWIGQSAIATVALGNGGSIATPNPFGTTTGQVGGIMMGATPAVPEPTTLALAALGGASLLLFRRKK